MINLRILWNSLLKTLYLLNNNVAVEAFTSRLIDTYSKIGIANAPDVLRLYPMQGEVKAGLKKTNLSREQDRPAVFDRQTAEDGLCYADDLGDNQLIFMPEFSQLFQNMTQPMKDAFADMSSLPAGIHFVPSVAGSPKPELPSHADSGARPPESSG
jgi:hypothetical protein